MHKIVLCADNRDVITNSIQKYLCTSYQLDDDDNKFYYAVYVSSDYLNAHVDSSRTSFDLPLEDSLEVFQDGIAPNDKLISIESIERSS